jgi:predicted dehydrogenase
VGSAHGVGIVGLGVISGQYLETLVGSSPVRITAVADLDPARADRIAATIPGARALSVPELMADESVRTVLNLTIPAAHAEIASQAIAAGKDVYGEKPLAVDVAQARMMMDAAARAGRRLGGAPDTVLGTGVQTARDAVDSGAIGRPVAASATWVAPGHEHWHPAPDFYYAPGGGPLLDMGPYYLTTLVHLLGPVSAVSGAASRTRSERTIRTGPRAGETIPVGVDSHVTGFLQHLDGAISTVVMSFDGAGTAAPPIEIHGEEGSLQLPDPNFFDGTVRRRRAGGADWEALDPSAGYAEAGRGIGLIDFVTAERPRADGAMAMHILEVMEGLLRSATSGQRVAIGSTLERPDRVPLTPRAEWRGVPADPA